SAEARAADEVPPVRSSRLRCCLTLLADYLAVQRRRGMGVHGDWVFLRADEPSGFGLDRWETELATFPAPSRSLCDSTFGLRLRFPCWVGTVLEPLGRPSGN